MNLNGLYVGSEGDFMKFFIILALTTSALQAQASGCGSYDNSRTIIQNDLVSSSDISNDFTILNQTADEVRIKDKKSGTVYNLAWEKTEKYEAAHPISEIEKRDVLFEEGNGCGPIYRCVSGQIKFRLANTKKHIVSTFSFPQILDLITYGDMTYTSTNLVPVFGVLKLDVPSIKSQGGDNSVDGVNVEQCGHGEW